MPQITSFDRTSNAAASRVNYGVRTDIVGAGGPRTVLYYGKPTTGGGGGVGYLFCGHWFRVNFSESNTRTAFSWANYSTGNAPGRVSANGTVTFTDRLHIAYTWDGGATSSGMRIYRGVNEAPLAELSYGMAYEGTPPDLSTSEFWLYNTNALNRALAGDSYYLAIWPRVLTLAELQQAQADGPLSVSGCIFLRANGAELVAGSTPVASVGITNVTTDLPPNLNLGGDSAALVVVGSATCAASSVLFTSIPLAASGVAQSAAVSALAVAELPVLASGAASSAGEAALTTGVLLSASSVAAGFAVANLDLVTTVFADFAGANINTATSDVADAATATPTVTVAVRSPDDGEWQQYLFRLDGVAGKTVTVKVSLFEKEDADTYEATYDGPWTATQPNTLNWSRVPTWSVSGGYITYTITPATNSVYIASTVPLNQDTALAWLQDLASTHPTLVHDDLPSRVAFSDGAYVCGRTGLGTDENGRQINALPLYGVRVANDAVGAANKRRIVMFCGVHCGEWNGFHELRGFVDAFATGADSAYLQANFALYVYPLVSALGSYLGYRRMEAKATTGAAGDPNRNWSDGAASVPSVPLWQAILDADHGVNHAEKVVGFIDWHDGKHTSEDRFYYKYDSQTNLAAMQAIIAANLPGIGIRNFTGIAGTTQKYWLDKGVNWSWTAEVSDENQTVAAMVDVGRQWAAILRDTDEAGLLPQPNQLAAAGYGVGEAVVSLSTSIALQSPGVAGVVVGFGIATASQFQSSGVGRVEANASLETAIEIASAAFSLAAGTVGLSIVDASALAMGGHAASRAVTNVATGVSLAPTGGVGGVATALISTAIELQSIGGVIGTGNAVLAVIPGGLTSAATCSFSGTADLSTRVSLQSSGVSVSRAGSVLQTGFSQVRPALRRRFRLPGRARVFRVS